MKNTKYYYKERSYKLHNLNGPALERADGQNYWFIDNVLIDVYSQEEFEKSKEYKVWVKLRAFI